MLAPTPIDDFFAGVRNAELVHALPEGVTVAFDLTGEGGGKWTVSREGDRADVRRTDAGDQPADCRLRCSTDDFWALLRGQLHPMDGFVSGRFAVEGDVGLVLRLHRSVV